MKQISDKKLAEEIITGNQKAFQLFYYRYKKPIHRFIQKRIHDEGMAEELVQDIFLQFLESLRDFRFQCKVRTYLYTIARNKTIDYIRKKKMKKVLFSRLPDFVVEGLAKVFLDDSFEKRILEKKIQSTFSQLPHEYERILRLKYLEGKSVKQIAEQLSFTFKSTESKLYRARKAFILIFNDSTI